MLLFKNLSVLVNCCVFHFYLIVLLDIQKTINFNCLRSSLTSLLDVHLTNVAVQKTAPDYDPEKGSKWSLQQLRKYLTAKHGLEQVNYHLNCVSHDYWEDEVFLWMNEWVSEFFVYLSCFPHLEHIAMGWLPKHPTNTSMNQIRAQTWRLTAQHFNHFAIRSLWIMISLVYVFSVYDYVVYWIRWRSVSSWWMISLYIRYLVFRRSWLMINIALSSTAMIYYLILTWNRKYWCQRWIGRQRDMHVHTHTHFISAIFK